MTQPPAPRPALRRTLGAQPAVPPAPEPHPAPPQGKPGKHAKRAVKPAKVKAAEGKTGAGAAPKDGRPVELVVTLPKELRRRLRAKAAENGYTAEEAAAMLLRVWVDG
jgi:hypothetical protein